jgi:hypothetical protein
MLLTHNPYYGQIVGMPVQVPQTFAVATDFFDQFMELNDCTVSPCATKTTTKSPAGFLPRNCPAS